MLYSDLTLFTNIWKIWIKNTSVICQIVCHEILYQYVYICYVFCFTCDNDITLNARKVAKNVFSLLIGFYDNFSFLSYQTQNVFSISKTAPTIVLHIVSLIHKLNLISPNPINTKKKKNIFATLLALM